jgi:hypothetical protein
MNTIVDLLAEEDSVKRHFQEILLKAASPILDALTDGMDELDSRRIADEPVGISAYILPKLTCTEATVFNDMKKGRLQFEKDENGKRIIKRKWADEYINWRNRHRRASL